VRSCKLLWIWAQVGLIFIGTLDACALIPVEQAKKDFAEVKALCDADHGELWGVSLWGPLMLVDPTSREIVGNQADLEGHLKPEQGVFTGILPNSENLANTAVDWSGSKWTQVVWTALPDDRTQRHILVVHELFHRVQDQIGLPATMTAENQHLDKLPGRYYLQLEWRALARALQAFNDSETNESIQEALRDALLFRWARYKSFPTAEGEEKELENNEGLAEYTGVQLGCSSLSERCTAATADISKHQKDATFVRSFAYATGPAYGLFLDRYMPGWRTAVKNSSCPILLAKALEFGLPRDVLSDAEKRTPAYDHGGSLWWIESARDQRQQEVIKKYRAQFVDHPVLVLPGEHLAVQFDPRNLLPLDSFGVVYPTVRVKANWGILEAENGVLMKKDRSAVILEAPASLDGQSLKGNGWTLELSDGWKVIPTARKGDYAVTRKE